MLDDEDAVKIKSSFRTKEAWPPYIKKRGQQNPKESDEDSINQDMRAL